MTSQEIESLRLKDEFRQTEIGNPINESELILSAYQNDNSFVFPKILELHTEKGDKIADITYGKGVFWKSVNINDYELYASDIDPEKTPSGNSIDCRNLPFEDNSFDAIVFDPPYAEGFYRRNDQTAFSSNNSANNFNESYSGGYEFAEDAPKYHKAVLNMYYKTGFEAKRVLKENGVFIVKTQDEVSSNTQELTHIQITNFYENELDFYTKDLFVTVRNNKPFVSSMDNQVHARKNHSYFMVYIKDSKPPSNTLKL